MTLTPREQVYVDNAFGIVSDHHIIYYSSNRSGASPVRGEASPFNILSVRLDIHRDTSTSIGYGMAGIIWTILWFLTRAFLPFVIPGLIFLILSVLALRPYPIIVIALKKSSTSAITPSTSLSPLQDVAVNLLKNVTRSDRADTVVMKGRPSELTGAREYVQAIHARITQNQRSNTLTQILDLAKQKGGRVTVTEVLMTTGLSLETIEEQLKDMMLKGYAHVENDPTTGVIVYWFPELQS